MSLPSHMRVDVLRRTSRELGQVYPPLKAVIAPSAARSSRAVIFRVAALLSFEDVSDGGAIVPHDQAQLWLSRKCRLQLTEPNTVSWRAADLAAWPAQIPEGQWRAGGSGNSSGATDP